MHKQYWVNIQDVALEQLQENLASIDINLTPEILAEIGAVHTRYPNPAP